jgi:hypothetical protein
VDKTIMEADQDHDGKISFEEFTKMVENTDVSMSMTLGTWKTLTRLPYPLMITQRLTLSLFRRSILDVSYSEAIPAG